MGGEKLILLVTTPGREGSPPRGRGKVRAVAGQSDGDGITPAWAGKSRRGNRRRRKLEDHPRVGGEKHHLDQVRLHPCGSPPRGRGKASPDVLLSGSSGITPAWAGKRAPQRCLSSSARDHPRVGGEKLTSPSVWRATPGSPPRGRGKGHLPRQFRCGRGITPAWAGKSCPARSRSRRWRDHPRVGGEKTKKIP